MGREKGGKREVVKENKKKGRGKKKEGGRRERGRVKII